MLRALLILSLLAQQQPPTSGARIATGSLPLGDLPAGDYVVRASVSAGGQQVGTISSALHVK